jgi:RimJ/RimL family protein N-acetyltransferase
LGDWKIILKFLENALAPEIILRPVKDSDLDIFFNQQLDADANYMAAFTAKYPTDRDAFFSKWEKIQSDKSIIIRTILFETKIAGHILVHSWFGDPEISYWIGKEFWGKGIASKAVLTFLDETNIRPLYARAASDNAASIRVLEKSGFVKTGTDKGFANARGEKIKEIIWRIDQQSGLFFD